MFPHVTRDVPEVNSSLSEPTSDDDDDDDDEMLKVSKSAALLQRQSPALRRSLATVADPPVRRYGGLKDQDRIFTNAYCRHDHGLKGALVSSNSLLCVEIFQIRPSRPAVIGTGQKTSFSKATLGSSKPSKTLGSEDAEVQVSLVDSNGRL